MSLEDVRVMKEPKVIDLDMRRRQVGYTDGDDELLVLAQRNPRRDTRYASGPNSQTQPHQPGPADPIAPFRCNLARECLSNGGEVG